MEKKGKLETRRQQQSNAERARLERMCNWENEDQIRDRMKAEMDELKAGSPHANPDAETILHEWDEHMMNKEEDNIGQETSRRWQRKVAQLLRGQMDEDEAEAWAKSTAERAARDAREMYPVLASLSNTGSASSASALDKKD